MPGCQAFTRVVLLAACCVAPIAPAVMQQNAEGAAAPVVVIGQEDDAPWPAPYTYLHRMDLSDAELKASVSALPFDHIEFERMEAWGIQCKLTLWRDGKAKYEGNYYAPREGTFEGAVSPYSYGRLCFLLEHDGFSALRSTYGTNGDDVPTCSLRVWRDGAAEPMTVTDYGSGGPIRLWGMQMVAEAVAQRIEWKPVPKSK